MLSQRCRSFLSAPLAIETFVHDKTGAMAIEYGLIAGIVSIAIIAGITQIGADLGDVFQTISDTFSGLL